MLDNVSLMADKDLTFFGDGEYNPKDSMMSHREGTKNSSNPEKISKIRESRNTNDRPEVSCESSLSKTEGLFHEGLIDAKIWSDCHNETQDSTQYKKKFNLLKRKEKGAGVPTPKNKVKKPVKTVTQFIPNNNYDYSADTEEFSKECDEEVIIKDTGSLVNRISSMQIKNNNITSLDSNSRGYCATETEEQHRRIYSMGINMPLYMPTGTTPQKVPSHAASFHWNNFNEINNNYNNFPRIIQRGSMVSNMSTHYSSNNKKKDLLSEDLSVDYIDSQYGTNEERRKQFSSSFNDNHFVNYENAFSFNPMMVPQNNINFQHKEKINKHTKSLVNLKEGYSQEKNVLNLDDIISGRDKRTTIMIRNIPIKYSDEMLIKELEEFKDKFDCLYLPFDFENYGNRGYAFINFVHPFHILLFYEKFEGKTWNFFESRKICELNAAKYQGINEIKRHARNYKGEKKPVFFFITDVVYNLEVPMKYRSQLKTKYPNITLEDTGHGVIKIKTFGK